MGPTSEDDDTPMELARFEGMYKDGQKTGYGKMVYPTGDIYEGEWFENKVQHLHVAIIFTFLVYVSRENSVYYTSDPVFLSHLKDARRRIVHLQKDWRCLFRLLVRW